jgi:hypothetical protein
MLEKIPSRIKYYLLDWKDQNLEAFQKEFGPRGLHDLNQEELLKAFRLAITQDQMALTPQPAARHQYTVIEDPFKEQEKRLDWLLEELDNPKSKVVNSYLDKLRRERQRKERWVQFIARNNLFSRACEWRYNNRQKDLLIDGVLLDYARTLGTPLDPKEYKSSFTAELIRCHGWLVELVVGQGSYIAFRKDLLKE